MCAERVKGIFICQVLSATILLAPLAEWLKTAAAGRQGQDSASLQTKTNSRGLFCASHRCPLMHVRPLTSSFCLHIHTVFPDVAKLMRRELSPAMNSHTSPPGLISIPFSSSLITILPPLSHLSYSFGIAVWHLAVARHSQADDQRSPITRIYGFISLQLII